MYRDGGRSGRIKAANGPNLTTFLEAKLPFKQLSLIANADRRAHDPVYGVHRWWARRPPGVIRGLLLAAVLPGDTSNPEFWRLFRSTGHALEGHRVHDLFIGGGTTVVEAARLGATPSGTDVDPLAVAIVRHELRQPDSILVARAGGELLEFLEQKVGCLYADVADKWIPLHYFYLHRVKCPHCSQLSALYRSLVIARDLSKNGGVIRSADLFAFCPDCFDIHELHSPTRKRLRCCAQYDLSSGNFAGHRFTCPHCDRKSTHAELQTGLADRLLLAVEDTRDGHRRRIRSASNADLALIAKSHRYLGNHRDELWLPDRPFKKMRNDSRPLSFGIDEPVELFTDRQLAVFGHAFKWLRSSDYSEEVRCALALAISGALATNNKLCSYATDYGRLAPLFSVRSYSLPALPVELNPFHPSAGRGTFRRSIERVVRSTSPEVRRYVWSDKTRRPMPLTMRFQRNGRGAEIRCASAETASRGSHDVDICLFDPPYFDYIPYSELSEFYRAWLDRLRLGGKPLLPDAKAPAPSYARVLARCLKSALKRLKRQRPLAFTFHSADPTAWEAIASALDQARLLVTAVWPVQNDAHMGHHSRDANCEWDLVIVCRRESECARVKVDLSVSTWRRVVAPLRIQSGDAVSMQLAIEMSQARFGRIRKGPDER